MIQDSNFYELADSNSSGGGHAKPEGNPLKDLGVDNSPLPWQCCQLSYFLHSKHFTSILPFPSDMYFGGGCHC